MWKEIKAAEKTYNISGFETAYAACLGFTPVARAPNASLTMWEVAIMTADEAKKDADPLNDLGNDPSTAAKEQTIEKRMRLLFDARDEKDFIDLYYKRFMSAGYLEKRAFAKSDLSPQELKHLGVATYEAINEAMYKCKWCTSD